MGTIGLSGSFGIINFGGGEGGGGVGGLGGGGGGFSLGS